jgi:Ribbon-helix-helix domain
MKLYPIQVRVPENIWIMIEKISKQTETPKSALIRKAIEFGFKKVIYKLYPFYIQEFSESKSTNKTEK